MTRKLYCHACGCKSEVCFMVEDAGFGFIDRDGRAAESLQLHRYPVSACCNADVYYKNRRFEGKEIEILSTLVEGDYRLERFPYATQYANTFSVELLDPNGNPVLIGHSASSYQAAEAYILSEFNTLQSYERTLSRIVEAIWG